MSQLNNVHSFNFCISKMLYFTSNCIANVVLGRCCVAAAAAVVSVSTISLSSLSTVSTSGKGGKYGPSYPSVSYPLSNLVSFAWKEVRSLSYGLTGLSLPSLLPSTFIATKE